MPLDFLNAFQSEWLKNKRSLGAWLVVVGALFTPAIVIVARLLNHDTLHKLYSADDFWIRLWQNSWESMAIFFLPMVAILATSLTTQIEYRNNTWKQVHVLPLHPATMYFAKLAVIALMVVQFFVLFNVGIYLSAVVPYLLIGGTPYPHAPMPLAHFLSENLRYFVDCLPIVAAQYLLSLRFRSFLVPIGVGFLAWVGALAALPWKFAYLVPYTYSMLDYLKDNPASRIVMPSFDPHWLAVAYFVIFTIGGYWLFATKAQKG